MSGLCTLCSAAVPVARLGSGTLGDFKEACQSGRMGLTANELSLLKGTGGSNPLASATQLNTRARSSTDRASDYGSEGWGFESLRAHLLPGEIALRHTRDMPVADTFLMHSATNAACVFVEHSQHVRPAGMPWHVVGLRCRELRVRS